MVLDGDIYFWSIALVTMFLLGLGKSGFLSGLGFIGVPLLSLIVSPKDAVAILLPILVLMDITAVSSFRRQVDAKSLLVLVPSACFGILIGWVFFSYVNDNALRLLVGLLAIIFVLDAWLKLRPQIVHRPSLPIGLGLGVFSGFTSTISHTGAPPIQMYLLPQRLTPIIHAGTSAWYFFAINGIKIVPYSQLSLFTEEILWTSLLLMPAGFLSVLSGVWLISRIKPQAFYVLAYTLVIVVGLWLTYQGSMGLWHGAG